MMKKRIYKYLFILLPLISYGQGNIAYNRWWQLTSVNGAAKVEGLYRDQTSTTNNLYDYQKSAHLYGGLILNTSSYVWHPNFVTLDVNGEYNPEKRQEKYLVIPDQSEARTMKKLDLAATFFRQKAINMGVFANFNESYNNRENLSNIKSSGSGFGASLNWSNKIVPFTASFHQNKWKETELLTTRSFANTQKNFQSMLSRSFSVLDRTELIYSHDEYDRLESGLYHVNNKSDYITLNNSVAFDKKRNYFLNSNLSQFDQKGNDTFKRTQVNELLSLAVLPTLDLSGTYSFIELNRLSQDQKQNSISGILRHRLYRSLYTSVSYDINKINQSVYEEKNHRATFDVRYEKSLPASGRLMVSYDYNNLNQQRKSESQLVQILNEEHTLKDGELVLLSKPYVEKASILVKDNTGTVFFQPGFDFVLVDRNNYVEIQRVPGGQISNNSEVFIDYMAMMPGSYKYDASFQQFSASLMFLNRLVEVYYRTSKQDYRNIESVEYLTLNYFTQNIYGARLEYKFISGGIEYDKYASTVIPYEMMRYFIQLQGNLNDRFVFSVYANLRDYKIIDKERNQQYSDLSGNMSYMLGPKSKINVELGYRKQTGNQIDLDLMTARTEFVTSYRQLFFKVGVEVYRRNYLHEKVDFNGAYFQIFRNFSWYKK